jgi:hypothetical protein
MRPVLTALAFALASALPAAAQPPLDDPNATVAGAAISPLRDLNIVRHKTPAVLQDAATAPYAHVAPQDCKAMKAQIADLDHVLGPDLDEATYNPKGGSLLADSVRSALRLPFGGVVSRLTGARKEEQDRDHAILAGYIRRAYLKGALASCDTVRDSPVHAAAAEPPPQHPDTVLAAPSNREALSTRDAAVDAGANDVHISPLPPPRDLPADILPSDAPSVHPLPSQVS